METAASLARIVVRPKPASRTRGVVHVGNFSCPCALGRGGIVRRKREGDGGTPAGRWRLVEVRYRGDRVRRPRTALPARPLRREEGWCDEPRDRNYNRPVSHPYPASAERLWRDDGLYDLCVVLDYNRRPRVRGRGSAIFLHVARPGWAPTEGCVALTAADLARLLPRLRRRSWLQVL
jgi:L,D-peptidoglycan transpeptidase YkuD (ErfK/YbiS/YcfS/YnhG family)